MSLTGESLTQSLLPPPSTAYHWNFSALCGTTPPEESSSAPWYNASRGELFHSELTGRWGCWDGVWLLMHGHHPRQLPALPASSHWTFAFLLLPLVSSFHQPNATISIPESQQRFGLPPGKWLSVGWGDSGGPPSQTGDDLYAIKHSLTLCLFLPYPLALPSPAT